MMIRIAGMIAIMAASALAQAQDSSTSTKVRKKVLVELYTSQGCNSCPPANEFLGELARQGFGADRIVPVGFHVDYFNEPWADPFSKKEYSQRQWAYNSVKKRKDLYFTPMMMVDGRYPMLGSNRPLALSSLRKALAEKPGASIEMKLSGTGSDRSLNVDVAPLVSSIAGRDLMVGVTVTEGPVSTNIPSGENEGKTLVEHFAVRSFAFQKLKFDSKESKSFTFPLKLGSDSVPSKVRVAAFIQDWDDGKVYQAESIPWAAESKLTTR
ncbi:DUF1223 domain-containing protein [Tundrisphaera lichenicola]|uniref:DUF1223 domain-containing protein n=1 Tax=Tundrisphaera lichenicola TaxID=2029860 RepID=UPI003EB8F109